MGFKEHLPWFSPDESVEACELLEEIQKVLEQMSTYGPLRKELRLILADKARGCSEFLGRANRPRMERGLVNAMEEIATRRAVSVTVVWSEMIEAFISKLNRSA